MELGFAAILALSELIATLLVGGGAIAVKALTPRPSDCRPVDPVTYEILAQECSKLAVAAPSLAPVVKAEPNTTPSPAPAAASPAAPIALADCRTVPIEELRVCLGITK